MDWNDLHIFAEIARTGSLKDAAKVLKIDPTTAGRRLKKLEQNLGMPLFEQTREGQILSPFGQKILPDVLGMEDHAAACAQRAASKAKISGTIRLSVSEGFGSFFITRHIGEFLDRYPDVSVDLIASNGFLSPSRKEADIAILLALPRKGPLISRKLSDYELGLYASRSWVEQEGTPKNLKTLNRYRLISYIPDLLYAPELDYLSEFGLAEDFVCRSSSIIAQMELIKSGMGIGILPQFMAATQPELVRLFPEKSIIRNFWIAVHQDISQYPRIRAFIDWLVAKCEHNLR